MEATKVIDLPVVQDGQPLDDWLWSVEELEEELGQATDAGTLVPLPPAVSSLELAEKHLYAVGRMRREQAVMEAHARQLKDRIDFWLNGRVARLERKLAWHQQGLHAFLVNSGKRTAHLVGGTLKLIAGRERVEVANPETFVATASPGLVRTKVTKEPDKRAILALIHGTGEIPDGVELVRADDSFKIETE